MANYSPLALAALATSAAAIVVAAFPPPSPVRAIASAPSSIPRRSIPSSSSFSTSSCSSWWSSWSSSSSSSSAAAIHSATTGSTTQLRAEREKYNPLAGALGDMASSLLSSLAAAGGSKGANPELDSKVSAAMAGKTWDEIRSRLESKQTEEERRFRPNLAMGYGAASPLHKLRLFDETNAEDDVRVTLYRDSASWCPYCQKVWLMLEEKRIPYRVEKINMRCYGEKPPSFTRMQPSGQIPVAVIDGKTYNQSNDIMYALESLFPDHKTLSPNSESDRLKAQDLLRLERQLFSAWMYWLTGPAQYRQNFINLLSTVESELDASRGGDFFLGKDVSIVDFMFAPFLERMAASLLYFKGYQIRVPPGDEREKTPYPALNKWFDAMEQLESYQLTKSDYYTHCWDLPPQLGGCTYEDGGEPYERAINGERTLGGTRKSWDLPLLPHNGGIEPDWDWCGDEGAARREATERLSHNHENIVRFAARGAGKKGIPPYSAPLADPNAVPNDAVIVTVDAALRIVAMSMLEGIETCRSDLSALANIVARDGGQDFVVDVISSLAYLRDRVGVPRDMRLPAARQLRAHLNWTIKAFLDAQEAL